MARHEGPTTRSKTRALRAANGGGLTTSGSGDLGEEEFPILKQLGLFASHIKGDGNCLFRALSDQFYGDDGGNHTLIRRKVVDCMRSNADYFSTFLDSHNESFDQYLLRMARDGVYGDNMEIVAFARHFQVDVVIYQADFLYVVPAYGDESDHKTDRRKVHIAYHTWEHYSSVRKIDGPFTGLPEVPFREPVQKQATDSGEDAKPKNKSAKWKVDVVKKSLPFTLSDELIKKQLDQHDGGIASTVEELLMSDQYNEMDDLQQASKISDSAGEQESNGSCDLLSGNNHSSDPTISTASVGKSHSKESSKPRVKRMTAREKKEKQKREALDRKRQRARSSGSTKASAAQPAASTDDLETGRFKTMYV